MFLKRLTPILFGLVLTAATATAQDSLLLRHHATIERADAWFSTANSAALTRYHCDNSSKAEMSLDWQRGGLTNYDGAPRQLQADVAAESYQRLSSRTVVAGGISYSNQHGSHMTGSAFLPSEQLRPFDLVEDSLTNPGSKHADRYRLYGAVGAALWHGCALGARLDYTSANYAKYKDLRHKNKLMQLDFSLSAYAPLSSWLNIGAAYSYSRHTESLQFSTYGKSDRVYKTLIDYGAFFGRAEQFAGEGFTDKSREMPLFEDGHGGSLQLGAEPTQQLSLLATAAVAHSTGYYGRPSPYTITYTHHKRNSAKLSLAAIYRPEATTLHRLDIAYSYEQLNNQASTYRELTNPSGATYYEYFDPVETGDKWLRTFSAQFTSLLGMRHQLPRWQVSAAYNWARRTQMAYLFPFFRRQQLSQNKVALQTTRHFILRRGVLSATLDAAFSWSGTQSPADDYLFTAPSDKQQAPATMQALLLREYQYLTAPQYALAAQARYTFIVPSTQLTPFVSLRASHRKANQTYLYSMGCDRTQLTATVGCQF